MDEKTQNVIDSTHDINPIFLSYSEHQDVFSLIFTIPCLQNHKNHYFSKQYFQNVSSSYAQDTQDVPTQHPGILHFWEILTLLPLWWQ